MTGRELLLLCCVTLAVSQSCSVWRNYASSTASAILKDNSRPWWNVNQSPWSGYWWKSANALETTSDYMTYFHDHSYSWVYDNIYSKGGSFINYYYDDEGWWGIAWLKAYERTGERRFLNLAESIHHDISLGWDSHCGGGVWWSKAKNYKNAIPNELFLVLSSRLYNATKNSHYLDWAKREWHWFKNSGMINSQNLINDGLTSDCKNNNGNTWTYNQGVILGGLAELYALTGDSSLRDTAQSIADAAIAHLRWSNGVLKESCDSSDSCGSDGSEFKGVFVRYLGQLYQHADSAHQKSYRAWLELNGNSLWDHDRGNGNNFGGSWVGPFRWFTDVTVNTPQTQVALDVFNAIGLTNRC